MPTPEEQRLNEAVEAIARRNAHDLRNPLATIRMAVDMLRREELPANATAALEIIDRQAQRALDVIDGLFDLALASRSPQRAGIDVAEVFARIADSNGVGLKVESTATVNADPGALEQIAHHLLANVATHAGGEAVLSCEQDRRGVTIALADAGPGIGDGDAEAVFKPFFRGTGSEGAGLGLALVRALSAAHGGRAWHEPRAGGGTTFSVWLPAADA